MEPKILEALKRLVGEEQALALAAQVDGVNRRVEHEQLIAREAEGAVSKSERALGIASQALEMLYRLADKDGLYLIDLFVEDGQFYAVATREGRLYRAPVTFDTGEAALTEAWQPVEVQHVPITRGISIREAEGAVSKSDATPTPSETPEAPEVRAVLEIRAALAENNAALAEVVHAITDMDARLQLLERSEQQRREAWLADLPALQPRELVRPRDMQSEDLEVPTGQYIQPRELVRPRNARPADLEVHTGEYIEQVLKAKGIA